MRVVIIVFGCVVCIVKLVFGYVEIIIVDVVIEFVLKLNYFFDLCV